VPAHFLSTANIEATACYIKKNSPIPYARNETGKYLDLPLLEKMKYKGKVISYYNTPPEEYEFANTTPNSRRTRKAKKKDALTKIDLMFCWNCIKKWVKNPNLTDEMNEEQVQLLLEEAVAGGGPIELWDNTSYFLLHQFQQHWLPLLNSMITSLHTRTMLDNARIQLNRLANSINKGVTHYKYACSSYLMSDEEMKDEKQVVLWPKNEIRQLARQQFIEPFKKAQKMPTRTVTDNGIVHYDGMPAETPCTQVVIWTMDDLNERHSVEKGMHNGQRDWNFEDAKVDYEYETCFTKDTDFNFTQKSFVMRAKYTEEAYDLVEKCNPHFWGEWSGGYKHLIEESMCMGKTLHDMMWETFMDDAKETSMLKSAQEMLIYKHDRAQDAFNNYQLYKRTNGSDASSDITATSSTGSGNMSVDDDMDNTTEGSDNVVLTPPELKAPVNSPADVAIGTVLNAASDVRLTLPSDVTDSETILPHVPLEAAGPSDIPDPQQSATDVLNNPDNVQQVNFGEQDFLTLRKYDAQYDDSMEGQYEKDYGKKKGAKYFEKYRKLREKTMIKNWQTDMRVGLPLIPKDPTFAKEILTANPDFMAVTMHALMENWDPFWKSLKQNTYLYEHFKKFNANVQQQFVQDEQLLAKNNGQVEHDSANPKWRNDTITPQPNEQGQQQSDGEAAN